MPIGFWAISRKDVKDLIAFYMKDYHKDPDIVTEKDIDRFIRRITETLDDTFRDAIIDFAISK